MQKFTAECDTVLRMQLLYYIIFLKYLNWIKPTNVITTKTQHIEVCVDCM